MRRFCIPVFQSIQATLLAVISKHAAGSSPLDNMVLSMIRGDDAPGFGRPFHQGPVQCFAGIGAGGIALAGAGVGQQAVSAVTGYRSWSERHTGAGTRD